MIKYVIKRLLIMIPTLLAVIFIVFFITNMTPGDPGSLILGQNASKEDIAKKNEELGFYDPTQEPSVVKIDTDKAKDWIAKGAKPTDTVAKLLKIAGIR